MLEHHYGYFVRVSANSINSIFYNCILILGGGLKGYLSHKIIIGIKKGIGISLILYAV